MKTFILIFSLLMAIATQANAFTPDFTGRILGGTSAGFVTVNSETAFLTNVEGDYFIDPNISVGGQVLMAISDIVIFAPQAVGKYTFDIHQDNLESLKPHIQGLMGFVVSDNVDTEIGFLGGFGFGADYFVKSNFSSTSRRSLHFGPSMPGLIGVRPR